MSATPGLPIEQFIQALTSQLDRVQSSMALKMHAGLPLTFAVKDLTLDLRAHVEMAGSVVRIGRPSPASRTPARCDWRSRRSRARWSWRTCRRPRPPPRRSRR